MARVLVVDDSKTDRLIVETLLSREEGIEVQAVEDGNAALEVIRAEPPDMVLTDLIMPGMDGLELVAEIRMEFPSVPVVLMTSKGNEEIAVRALASGAASYVPKRLLADILVDTVREVLGVARRQQAENRLNETLFRSESEFKIENLHELVLPLVKHLQGIALTIGLCDEGECTQVGVALCEALNNAIEHGNLEIESAVREKDLKAHEALMRERRESAPYRERRVHVMARFDREKAHFVVRDEGPGFDPSSLADPCDPANLDRYSGRGVMLIRSFMDEVTYNERGNEVTMVKHRSCGEDEEN